VLVIALLMRTIDFYEEEPEEKVVVGNRHKGAGLDDQSK
jgi:hypothetical protein